jgi:predicted PurR-regulated permease PerM
MTSPSTASPRDLTRDTLVIVGIGVLIASSLFVLRPFIVALLWATMIVVSTWPLMLKVQARVGGRRGVAVAVMTVVLLAALFVPLWLAVSTILSRTDRVMELAKALPTTRVPPPPAWVDNLPVFGARLAGKWAALSALEPEQLSEELAPHLRTALSWFAAQAGSFGGMLLQFLLTVIISAILYSKGEGGVTTIRRFFRRLAGARGDEIVTLSGAAIRAVALGIVVTAVVQSALAAIGLFATGVPLAGFIAAVVFVFCIAQIGPLLPLVPAVIWLYASGSPGRGTVLLVLMLFAQMIDNVLRPVLIKRGADLSLLLIFPGVIGGLLWLGIIGLFVGPVVLAVTATLVQGWMGTGEAAAAPPEAAKIAAGGGGGA